VLIALGSRGDVQPFVALALRLMANGHRVRLLAAADYYPLVTGYGVEFAPLVGSVNDLMDRELVYDFLEVNGNPLKLGVRFMRSVDWAIGPVIADCWRRAQDAELLIASTLGMFAALHIAEKLSVPCIPAHRHPNAPTKTLPAVFAPSLAPGMPFRGAYNQLTHFVSERGFWEMMRPYMNRARQAALSLPPLSPLALARRVSDLRGPVLYGYSETIAPRPTDWPANQFVTGYWFLNAPETYQPDDRLAAFVASGPPPVYVGFGSTLVGRHPETIARLIIEALARNKQRGIVYSSWGDLGAVTWPDSVLRIDDAPSDWLFPRMAAVVHHGGAGTTATALRAGVPAVIVPAYGDQKFWAKRVYALGASVAPIPRLQLSADRLGNAIAEVLRRPEIRVRAAELRCALGREDGVGNAGTLIEQFIQSLAGVRYARN
jgi:UDP:flavonoid glycosyltransferase YjiC (YdhE family)